METYIRVVKDRVGIGVGVGADWKWAKREKIIVSTIKKIFN